ncbi:MAG: exopolyphosphatase/guanosine-5'-triphosphate,3'-diphosphate pyrophosphatase [Myxococcota bacterium]|jgi:exopolyphosphatase/guanosine-5'-triphosphate,3'-diphosphate pyrophosphatase
MSNQLAAIDLGSNSFHMIVAQVGSSSRPVIVDRIKEPVRLAAGLDASGNITAAAADRALSCLGQFAERLAGFSSGQVRAVGTNTLRRARNRLDFLELAQETLGHRIDIIPGTEEARLIYAGVGTAFDQPGRRLVIDIGGGSTELILGQQEPEQLTSRFMGCVSWSERFFGGRVTRSSMNDATNAARRQLGPIMRSFRKTGWEHALGASGTIKAIEAVLMQSGMTADGITMGSLEALADKLIDLKRPERFQLPGLPEHRRPVIAGGLAILIAAFRSLHIDNLTWVNAALKEGLLTQMIGRINKEDIRSSAVARLAERLEVDVAQANRVTASALWLFDQVAESWSLRPQHRQLLTWATALHESGQFINHASAHKHSAYLLAHADLPGFSRQDQGTIAATVLGHRGRLGRDRILAISPSAGEATIRLSILLRLASTIHRTRSSKAPPVLKLTTSRRHLKLTYPDKWLDSRPLTRADLTSIADRLAAVGYRLTWR